MCFRIEIKTKHHVANQFNQNSYGLANTRRLPCFTQKEIAILIKRVIIQHIQYTNGRIYHNTDLINKVTQKSRIQS